jgi:cytochrome d ubiquinol oxidase subunit II
MRGVSFEYRGKSQDRRWRGTWSWALTIGSLLVPLLIGIALGDLLHGLPINSSHEYTGTFWNLLQPYAIVTGVTLVSLCLLHGALFIAMKTTDEVRPRAWRIARRISPVTGLLVLAFVAWTHVSAHEGAFLNLIELVACLAVLAAIWEVWADHEGWAFTATTVTIASCIVTLFTDLYPRVMVSSTSPAYSLTVNNSASPTYTLKVMTVIAVILLPLVLGYQAWTYYVFRQRVIVHHFRPGAAPDLPPAATPPLQRSPLATSGPQQAAASDPPSPERRKRQG